MQLMSFPYFSHTIPLAFALLIMRMFGTWVCWCVTMNKFYILAISSSSFVWRYQYLFLFMEGPKKAFTSSSRISL